ncbi:hypothetical protein PILCRDRAFT_681007 [Piloderma croceum F 1598]|uniref:Uncharacterized protein n=1 Tax=Piloderma croceum (strain F 1598) TaxID=765440 RepID=A0A0C3F5Y8_PILCF|nr:hypothetical protein PILCRDRAFT_681007 [Piloderma croceum F 1598]
MFCVKMQKLVSESNPALSSDGPLRTRTDAHSPSSLSSDANPVRRKVAACHLYYLVPSQSTSGPEVPDLILIASEEEQFAGGYSSFKLAALCPAQKSSDFRRIRRTTRLRPQLTGLRYPVVVIRSKSGAKNGSPELFVESFAYTNIYRWGIMKNGIHHSCCATCGPYRRFQIYLCFFDLGVMFSGNIRDRSKSNNNIGIYSP